MGFAAYEVDVVSSSGAVDVDSISVCEDWDFLRHLGSCGHL